MTSFNINAPANTTSNPISNIIYSAFPDDAFPIDKIDFLVQGVGCRWADTTIPVEERFALKGRATEIAGKGAFGTVIKFELDAGANGTSEGLLDLLEANQFPLALDAEKREIDGRFKLVAKVSAHDHRTEGEGLLQMAHDEMVLVAELAQEVSGLPRVLLAYDDEVSKEFVSITEDCGMSAAKFLDTRWSWGVVELLGAARSLFGTLAGIHERGYAHLDIKPANICLRVEDETWYLIDFNLAQKANPAGAFPGKCGTRTHQPADQLEEECTQAVDVWALGATLYDLWCGVSPAVKMTKTEETFFRAHREYEREDGPIGPLEGWRKASAEREVKESHNMLLFASITDEVLAGTMPGIVGLFLQCCLEPEAKRRLSAEQALEDPCFDLLREAEGSDSEVSSVASEEDEPVGSNDHADEEELADPASSGQVHFDEASVEDCLASVEGSSASAAGDGTLERPIELADESDTAEGSSASTVPEEADQEDEAEESEDEEEDSDSYASSAPDSPCPSAVAYQQRRLAAGGARLATAVSSEAIAPAIAEEVPAPAEEEEREEEEEGEEEEKVEAPVQAASGSEVMEVDDYDYGYVVVDAPTPATRKRAREEDEAEAEEGSPRRKRTAAGRVGALAANVLGEGRRIAKKLARQGRSDHQEASAAKRAPPTRAPLQQRPVVPQTPVRNERALIVDGADLFSDSPLSPPPRGKRAEQQRRIQAPRFQPYQGAGPRTRGRADALAALRGLAGV